MKKILLLAFIITELMTACTPESASESTQTSMLQPTVITTSTATQIETSTSTPDLTHLDPAVILLEQNFEAGTSNGLLIPSGDWSIVNDDEGNHSLCNKTVDDIYSVIIFGKSWWKDYAVEVKLTEQGIKENPVLQLMTRTDQSKPSINEGYYVSMNFENYQYELAVTYPDYRSIKQGTFQPSTTDPITMRVEAFGDNIRYFINDHLVTSKQDNSYSQGNSKLVIFPGLTVCIADIRAWALTETGDIGKPEPGIASSLEIVTDQAMIPYVLTAETQETGGIGGNNWGGHQSRIVRTNEGVFTAYIIAGTSDFARVWQLARRQEDSSWLVIAQGDAGKDPVHLLASPDGTLHVIGWPKATGTMWSGKPEGNQITMTQEIIPGLARDNWPYSSAGIDLAGDICVLSTQGAKPGVFAWACYLPSQERWISKSTTTDYGFRYTYVFPDPTGGLSLVSTRDVLWSVLGYKHVPGTFNYASNAVGYWRTDNIENKPLERVFLMEEKPTEEFPYVILNSCQTGGYIDTYGNIHIIYVLQGARTQGAFVSRHLILSPNGETLSDTKLPYDIGYYSRIFQDAKGDFYILGSSGDLYPAGKDGRTLGTPYHIDLEKYPVGYSGIYITVPRSGTPTSNILDVVYPSEDGTKWIYFQITLP